MDIWNNIIFGFHIASVPENLLFCFIGVLAGTLVGVLPGLGPAAAMSLLLPLVAHMPPVSSMIMLAGIYYGAMYGGSTTSILVNIPGEAGSIVTCLDGHQMALQGRAGPALGISAFGSFIGGTFAIIVLNFIAEPLADFAIQFGPPEYFSLMCAGIGILCFLTEGSFIKSLISASIGLFLGTIGMDLFTGAPRFTFGIPVLYDGVGLVVVVMGMFGITEILLNIESIIKPISITKKIDHLFPNKEEWKASAKPIARASILGTFLGVIPGRGVILASFTSYALEKKLSKHPETFGKGAIEGVAGPETANNAASGGGFIPLLTLGIPPNATTAMLLAALLILGVQPGPLLVKQHPDIFWGTIMSMYIGNGMLLILNLPLIGIWVKILKIPYAILFPLILLLCVIGVYSLNNSITEIFLMIFFGAVGYLCKKIGFAVAPLILAMILGPIFEFSFRQSLMMSLGKFSIFISSPIAIILLMLSFLILFSGTFRPLMKSLNKALKE
jgi:putative tricarboxylic transport membrane protein